MMKSKPRMKGISLPLETVVLLILAAIVLAALLGFFLSAFTPAQSKVDIIKKQTSYCQQIFATDGQCLATKVEKLGTDLQSQVCNHPSDSPVCSGTDVQACINNCCRIFCPAR